MKTDTQLRHDVADELQFDPALNAGAAPGVTDVDNRITVTP
jgi:hypothetical protein